MAYTTINKSSSLMNTVLYSGNSSTQAITGVGFQPDWCWFKGRNFIDNHVSIDAVRGNDKAVYPDTDGAETTQSHYFSSFDSDGYTLGNSGIMNLTGRTYASWNWKANGSGSANTDGSISSTVSANTTSGFSIVKFTGTGANATVGHGLGVIPKMMFVRNLTSGSQAWRVHNSSLASANILYLNQNSASSSDATSFNSTAPTSSLFSVGSNTATNGSTNDMIAYCFAEVAGYSKFGSYTGNGVVDGTFIYTGFKPSFIITKRVTGLENWMMFDNKRLGYNVDNNFLFPNLNNAEVDSDQIDILSNGFKMRTTNDAINNSGGECIYMAFGQTLVGTNNIPATAR